MASSKNLDNEDYFEETEDIFIIRKDINRNIFEVFGSISFRSWFIKPR